MKSYGIFLTLTFLSMFKCKGIIKVPKGKHGFNTPNFKKGYFNPDDQGDSPYYDMGCKFNLCFYFSSYLCCKWEFLRKFGNKYFSHDTINEWSTNWHEVSTVFN